MYLSSRGVVALLLVLTACKTAASPTVADAVAGDAVAADGGGCHYADGILYAPPANPECNPLAWDKSCLSGLPSAFYEKDDTKTATGRRVDLPASIMPVGSSKTAVVPDEWNRRDGFSPNAPIVVLPPKPVDAKSLHDETNPTDAADAAVVLVDAATGQRIKHFEELDLNSADPARQGLLVRAWTPIQENRRIIVGITDKLLGKDGAAMPRPVAFQRLLDCKPSTYARIDDHLAEWRADLDLLAKAGVAREHLVTAWHYDTASVAWTHGVALQARDLLVQAVGAEGLSYDVTLVEVDPQYAAKFPNLPKPADDPHVVVQKMHSDVAMRIRGRFETPLFLTAADKDATLNWTGTGAAVAQNGTTMRDFIILVPPAVVKNGGMARLMIYGHGLLRGACVEGCVKSGDAEFMPHLAAGAGAVMMATDWWGLSQNDFLTAVTVTNNLTLTPRLTDKLVQAAVQPIAMSRVVQHKLLKDPWFRIGDDAKSAKPMADASTDLVYYGNSLGGIMGTTMTSMHPDLHRMVMNVAGCVWSMLMSRSSDFKPFFALINGNYPDPFEQQVMYGLMQSMWDLSDPVNFADHVIAEPFPGVVKDRKALWPVSWGDSQVPNLSSGMLERVGQQPLSVPAVSVWTDSLTDPTMPQPKSAWIQWDSKRGTQPPGNALPDPDNGAHIATRWMPEFQQMVVRFLFGDGLIEPRYCLVSGRDTDGKLPCDLTETIPETEAAMKPPITLPLPAIP